MSYNGVHTVVKNYPYQSMKNFWYLQGDGTTWEIHLGTRLRVKVVPPNIFNSQCISPEWPVNFVKIAFEILLSAYILLS